MYEDIRNQRKGKSIRHQTGEHEEDGAHSCDSNGGREHTVLRQKQQRQLSAYELLLYG